jgi:uncharacterized membrane protein
MMRPTGRGTEETVGESQEHSSGGQRAAKRSRVLLGAFFIGGGVNHFVNRRAYEAIVPPSLQSHATEVVQISGVAEIAGGLGVLVGPLRRHAGLGLIALLMAVFPANIYMAREPERFKRIPRWALYGRLPLQPLMVLWAWRATRRRQRSFVGGHSTLLCSIE